MTENDYEYRDQQREAYGLELLFITLGLAVVSAVAWLVA